MNIPRLREIQEKIRMHPEHFDMSYWYKNNNGVCIGDTPSTEDAMFECGTTACIAGWACLDLKDTVVTTSNVESLARKILDLTYFQGERLFFTDDWPREFIDGLDKYGKPTTTTELAIARIDHFIATEGKE